VKEELKVQIYESGVFTVSKDSIEYMDVELAQGFGCDLGTDESGKCPVWVVFGGNLYYLTKANSVKQAVQIANNLNDCFDRIVKREKEDVEWPCL